MTLLSSSLSLPSNIELVSIFCQSASLLDNSTNTSSYYNSSISDNALVIEINETNYKYLNDTNQLMNNRSNMRVADHFIPKYKLKDNLFLTTCGSTGNLIRHISNKQDYYKLIEKYMNGEEEEVRIRDFDINDNRIITIDMQIIDDFGFSDGWIEYRIIRPEYLSTDSERTSQPTRRPPYDGSHRPSSRQERHCRTVNDQGHCRQPRLCRCT